MCIRSGVTCNSKSKGDCIACPDYEMPEQTLDEVISNFELLNFEVSFEDYRVLPNGEVEYYV
jgi:hypothetical protein